jgi:hypothetical protein
VEPPAMGTLFTVIQFVPDPVADERLNAGLIVYTDEVVKLHFSHNLKRLERFADTEKVEFFREFQQDLVSRAECGTFSEHLSRETLEQMIQKWSSLIQFTRPRGSLLDPEPLLKQITRRFLPADTESEQAANPSAGRALRSCVRQMLKDSIRSILGKKSALKVKSNIGVTGSVVEHKFSVGIVNGVPRLAAQVIAFDDKNTQESRLNRIHSTAWTFSEILRQPADKRPKLAVIIDETSPSRPEFEEARQAFGRLQVEMVPEVDLKSWADKTVEEIAAESH